MLIEEIRAIKSEKKDLRNFGLSVGGVFLTLSALLYWYERPSFPVFLAIGGLLVLLGLALPRLLLPLQRVWMAFAVVMGFIMTRVILSILFYIAFTGIGLILRITGKKLLEVRIDKTADSYWNYRNGSVEEQIDDKSRHELQF